MIEGDYYKVCTICGFLREWNDTIFRGKELNAFDVWSLISFHVSLWISVTKLFCNYFLVISCLIEDLSCRLLSSFVWAFSFVCSCFLSPFFSIKA